MNISYPWHQVPTQQVLQYWQAGRLPHALILSGMAGMGQLDFAYNVAQMVLCAQVDSQGQVCGQCYSCKLSEINQHPDFYSITPETPGLAIKVEAIRELIEQLQMASHNSGYRVVVISPAEAMNAASANALLKTLEEPGADCLFLLITESYSRLMATIRSRCQVLKFIPDFNEATVAWLKSQLPDSHEDALALLKAADGAPLQALQLAEEQTLEAGHAVLLNLVELSQRQASPLSLAQSQNTLAYLDKLLNCLFSLTYIKLGQPAAPAYMATIQPLLPLLHAISIRQWMDYTYSIMQARADYVKNPNLNGQQLLESLLIAWPLRKG